MDLVAIMRLAYFELRHGAFHAVTGLLLLVLTAKVVVIRRWHAAGRFLPALGFTVFAAQEERLERQEEQKEDRRD